MGSGQVIGGSFERILVRQKAGRSLEIGELMVGETEHKKIIFQVIDLRYSSQVSQSNIEYIAGMKLEENTEFQIMDKHLRYYTIAELRSVLSLEKDAVHTNKELPAFFTVIRSIMPQDISLPLPKHPLVLGKLRSGSKEVDLDVSLDGKEVLSHHVLIAATTGKGKSNLASCILWGILNDDFAGVLVLDPHDEYYGRSGLGLKDHPQKERVVYYTPFSIPPGARTLKINITKIKPRHLDGVLNLTEAQSDAVYTYYKRFGKEWIQKLLLGEEVTANGRQLINESTLSVLRRKFLALLSISLKNDEHAHKDEKAKLICKGIFDFESGQTTIENMCDDLEKAKTVIIDTSHFEGSVEILIGSMVSGEILSRYKRHKQTGRLSLLPVVAVVLEEAPRVLSKDVLERGSNIFSTIAREGRKFKIGLVAITQLPSVIPKDILANMNTKIVLGIEMNSERQAIIESAAQDLSADNRNIASLDKGEAIITSSFTRFAVPVKIRRFADLAKDSARDSAGKKERQNQVRQEYSGVKWQ